MAFSNVVIANSYLFGENRYDICVFVQYISCILFIVALCTGKYKLRDLIVRGLIGIIVIFITINLRSTEFGVYSLAIIASLNIDSKRIVRFNVISNICFIVSVVLPALIGIILSLFILSLEIYFTQLRRPFGQRKWLLLICFISE